mmetsp:Transcript_84257/g.181673  ORF Transcript_84257/g.181673 Transcript_84257/m.181673 type:complete len:233 (-) Transcript_84257:696-1394(-)
MLNTEFVSSFYPVSYDLLPLHLHVFTDILRLILHNLAEERNEFFQACVFGVVEPSCYENAVFRVDLEVFSQIVNYEHFGHISAQLLDVFDEDVVADGCVLALQPLLDQPAPRVQLVQTLVCLLLGGSGEDHQFLDFSHALQELLTVGPHLEQTLPLLVLLVDQGFIQVQHQGLLLLGVHRGQLRLARRLEFGLVDVHELQHFLVVFDYLDRACLRLQERVPAVDRRDVFDVG